MRVGEIVKPQNFSLFRRLLDAKLWNRQAEDFSHIDLDTLFALVSRFETKEVAQRACDIVVLKLKAAQVGGDVEYVRVDQKAFVRPPMTEEIFEKGMERMTPVRQMCVRFALEMQWPLDPAVALERADIKQYFSLMNERAVDIVKAQPISMFKRTVFWEDVNGEPRMLISLRHQFLQTFGQPWDHVMTQYDTNNGCFIDSVTKEQALNTILHKQ